MRNNMAVFLIILTCAVSYYQTSRSNQQVIERVNDVYSQDSTIVLRQYEVQQDFYQALDWDVFETGLPKAKREYLNKNWNND